METRNGNGKISRKLLNYLWQIQPFNLNSSCCQLWLIFLLNWQVGNYLKIERKKGLKRSLFHKNGNFDFLTHYGMCPIKLLGRKIGVLQFLLTDVLKFFWVFCALFLWDNRNGKEANGIVMASWKHSPKVMLRIRLWFYKQNP